MSAASLSRQMLGTRSELFVIAAVVGILVVLFSPIPPGLLDFLLISNFCLAALILLLTFYTDKPLTFSTFPSILLIATLLRLSLNVAATRLILTDAYAGRVIEAIGSHVVAGNYVIGLVVFLILIVVQFVVVTNGAQRVAEVAARFTLDAMPGKQMSIDADLNMGLITEVEARERRKEIEREANFYGAMDGASKFVKGDAIAGIIIILINIIGGLAIGLVQKGMEWSEALATYTLLTVGDGIVTQIPALVIATATGILVTRAATDADLTKEMLSQVTRYPKSLVILGGALFATLFLPGMPVLPVLAILVLVVASAVVAYRASAREQVAEPSAEDATATGEEGVSYAALAVEPLEMELGAALRPLVGQDDSLFMKRVKAFRRQHATESGLIIPSLRLREEARRSPQSYAIRFFGATVAEGEMRPDSVLAINPGNAGTAIKGEKTRDPTFGLPALWIAPGDAAAARAAGFTVVEPLTVLVTHFSEVIRNQGHHLVTRQETERLVGTVREAQPSLVEELIPGVLSLSDVQKVLKALLKERVPIRNMDFVLEALLEAGRQVKDHDSLTERVREKLGLAITQRFASKDGSLHVLTLEAATDKVLRDAIRQSEGGTTSMDPGWMDRLVRALSRHVEEMLAQNIVPVLICAPSVRRFLRRATEASLPHLNVISTSELNSTLSVRVHATAGVN
ncbi:flagellar biosynthesis protein FlhA [Solimonas sp. SE-A11]|uniref:flagellar biosynthesis protein FlhA n=1 Tax=Solimonas sp. SE-A11 TaxID=3054954 RepID=UPI00259C9420|nr:flagellar biosynthesis protein FlhA [Solimonas sp. SE-A11]MDM4772903.1 flagellar biosynthesis protein FlhA [Solimonas sp. SE-A11]